MAEILRLEDGRETSPDDPNRGMWYAADPNRCGYWTDDWSKLKLVGSGIPACPICFCVGMQMTMKEWDEGVTKFEADNHPHYIEFTATRKEACFKNKGDGWGAAHLEFVKAKEAEST